MSVSEELLTRILLLIPNHPTLETLLESDALKDVRAAEIYAALRILDDRKLVSMDQLFGRDTA